MREKLHQVLPYVNNPSTYLGSEKNRYHKPISAMEVHFLLAFPDIYEIAMSYFGSQILYHILNQQPHIYAEQAFAPAPDFEQELRRRQLPLWSLESHTPAKEFDIIGFSLLYELNYTNILTMLSLADIPFLAKDRAESASPILIAGGPCAFNPEPVADIFDAIVIGDGEQVILEMMAVFTRWKKEKTTSKTELLQRWSKITGVYIPSFFTPEYEEGVFTRIQPQYSDYTHVQRAIAPNLDTLPFPSAPVVPYADPVHNRLRIEISRGCTRGCRFCQAGMIYRPVRERSETTISRMAKKLYRHTGMDELSLLSLSVGDYSSLVPMLQGVNKALDGCKVSISFPSIRAEAITDDLMEEVKTVRKTGFTIAPEAGSDRLRRVINKSMTREDIESAVETAFRLGWKTIKLYFMLGLPTETDADLDETLQLLERLQRIQKGARIHASFATFIPKPHTPFQWANQISVTDATDKINYFKQHLPRSLQMKWQDPKVSVVEGLFSRGDRRILQTLLLAWEKGCRMDGWSDYFRYDLWQQAFEETGMEPNRAVVAAPNKTVLFPWDHICFGVTQDFLWAEWERAHQEIPTPDCRHDKCSRCGVCDFKTIRPQVALEGVAKSDAVTEKPSAERPFQKWHVTYQKKKEARFLGHLELMQVFLRALRRSDAELKYSNGFHPHPKIQFDDPLPLGMESNGEFFTIEIATLLSAEQLQARVNQELPEGLAVITIKATESTWARPETDRYRIYAPHPVFSPKKINDFLTGEPVLYQWKTKKGEKKALEIQDMISGMSMISEKEIEIEIHRQTGKKIRPSDILKTVFLFTEKHLADTIVCKV